jgi:hypothetical protein
VSHDPSLKLTPVGRELHERLSLALNGPLAPVTSPLGSDHSVREALEGERMRVSEGKPICLVEPGAVVLARRVELVEEGVVDDSVAWEVE